jgi:ferric-dicitrate binding protein FerR (iron transport regulator)
MRKRDVLSDAASWFVDILTTPDLDQLWPQFERWLQKSDEHRCAYESVERAWCAGYWLRERSPRPCRWPRIANILH